MDVEQPGRCQEGSKPWGWGIKVGLSELGAQRLWKWTCLESSCVRSTYSSTSNALLSQVAQADLRLADKQGSWTHQVLTALNDVPHAQ
eukprot:1149192-Pelagomonas_calceolata.AAC.1